MKLQKTILCTAVALTAFGASLGLLEIGRYLRAAVEPLTGEIKAVELFESPVYAPERRPELKQTAFTTATEIKPEVEPENSDKTGYYYIIGEQPKGFRDFGYLEISTYEYDEKLGKVVPVKIGGSINFDKRYFDISKINITGERIAVVTKPQKGISYQFDGKFIDEEQVKYKDEDGEEITNWAVLEGRLTKWRSGVKIAEAKVKFSYSLGC